MGSFYGVAWGKGDGSGGTGVTSYNQLTNTPITNLTGSVSYPIVFKDLAMGNYNLIGYFQQQDGQVRQSLDPLAVVVQRDNTTGDKIVIYQEIDNGDVYLNKTTIKTNGETLVEKLLLGGSETSVSNGISEEVLLFQF